METILLGLGQAGFSSPYDAQGTGHASRASQNLLELRINAFHGFLSQLLKEQFGETSGLETRLLEETLGMYTGSCGLVLHYRAIIHGYLPFSLKKIRTPK